MEAAVMDARGYRAQIAAGEGEPEPAVEVKRGIPLATVGVGILALAATAAAAFFIMRFVSSEGQAAAGQASIGATGSATPGGLEAPSGEYGPADAPVQILAIPGHCEGHQQMVKNLQALSKEYPKELHVIIASMGGPEASAEGRSCASYLMKVRGREEPGATPGGYTLLAEKTPEQGWTPEGLTEQIRDTLNSVRKSSGGGAPAAAEGSGKAEASKPTRGSETPETRPQSAANPHAGNSH